MVFCQILVFIFQTKPDCKQFITQNHSFIYLDVVIFYNQEQDNYEQNGMIVQRVTGETAKKEKGMDKDQRKKMPILGNIKVFAKGAGNAEARPGHEGTSKAEIPDDLPF